MTDRDLKKATGGRERPACGLFAGLGQWTVWLRRRRADQTIATSRRVSATPTASAVKSTVSPVWAI